MTWYFVGATEAEWKARVERARRADPSAGEPDAYLADLQRDCILGTPDQAAERLAEYAAAGVQRVFMNHELFDDLEMLELLAQVIPMVASGVRAPARSALGHAPGPRGTRDARDIGSGAS
jgi:alkanesulfonate monooxygenase SsuD/methylene tetrahydromethanopterin reductase-like flavin-dependent oxidoreductase (luciferase family)